MDLVLMMGLGMKVLIWIVSLILSPWCLNVCPCLLMNCNDDEHDKHSDGVLMGEGLRVCYVCMGGEENVEDDGLVPILDHKNW